MSDMQKGRKRGKGKGNYGAEMMNVLGKGNAEGPQSV